MADIYMKKFEDIGVAAKLNSASPTSHFSPGIIDWWKAKNKLKKPFIKYEYYGKTNDYAVV